MPTTNGTTDRRNRRGILAKAFVVGAAAVAAKAAGSTRTEAADGQAIKIGQGNGASSLTELGGSFAGPVFEVYNLTAGRGSGALMGIVAEGYPVDPAPSGGAAVYGLHGGSNGHGVWGQVSGIFGSGVVGYATNTGSSGVYAYAEQGDAIYAQSKADNSYALEGYGVFGGVYAEASRGFGTALHGVAKGGSGWGVRGQADSGVGVEGTGSEAGVKGFGDRGVSAQGNTIGVVGGGGVIGVAANAFQDEGIGLRASGKRAGLIATSPAGEANGPGAWANAGQDITESDANGVRVGVLGTSPATGIAGVGGGLAFALVKGQQAKTGVLGVGIGAGSRGVHGKTDQGSGIGVLGESGGARGVGVQGLADPLGIGVLAQAPVGATALAVRGINRFTQAGMGVFNAGENRVLISGLEVTTRSGILVTLNDPAGAATLQFARVNPRTKKALLQLSGPAPREVRFTYFIVDSPAP